MHPFCSLLIKAVRHDSPPFAVNGKPVGQLLVKKRVAAGLTQEALAERLGVSRKTLQNWERDRTKPIRRFWTAIRSTLNDSFHPQG